MKVYIEYENPVEASCNLVKVIPKSKNGEIKEVSINFKCKPTIIQNKPYLYEQEIEQMLLHINNQNIAYEKLKKELEEAKKIKQLDKIKPKGK